MNKKTVFWMLFTLVFIISTTFAVKYFSRAFPIVNLDIHMDREQAVADAAALAQKFAWGPVEHRQAASFNLDQQVQNFVELEAGGTAAFNELLKSGLYSPYTWNVRLFQQGETNETTVYFTPAGEPYGFWEKLAEDAPGAALEADSARAIAENAATTDWRIDLSPFTLIEASKEVKPGGRVDHTFVYEQVKEKIGDGRYRLRLVVGGDKLTELTHFVKIPEAFSRKYSEMRSANETIATVAMVGMVLLYFIGGCIIGLFFLLRQRWVVWRPALYWGVFVAFLQLLAGLNNFPLLWMGYDTALSMQGFLLRQIVSLLGNFFIFSVVFTLSFMAAESLSRKAFPNHVQFWRSWSGNVGGSKTILGRTVAAYWLVGIFFAFEIVLYFVATRLLGWWSPSEALFDPDVLASYFPWLTAIANSLQAGFWEESLFRAVPLAGAALLGQKYGRKRLWIAAAVIIQALIFSAGHANYPNQPAYARVVELLIPSFMFAALYLYFGLLPGIVLHFVYDVVWFALPLFVAKIDGIWVQQLIVVVLTFIPLWIILYRRIRNGRWTSIEASDLNRAWRPPALTSSKSKETPAETKTLHPRTVRILPVVGVLGVLLWALFANFDNYAPPLDLQRRQAMELARETLQQRGISLDAPWKALSRVTTPRGEDDRFIWQTGGADAYRQLIGSYLGTPHWTVRYARFEGDVAERAEEFQIAFGDAKGAQRFRHQLPEARPGDSLSVQEASALADSVIRANFPETRALKQVSVEPQKRPARLDWTFTFADTVNYSLEKGEARIGVEIAGNEVVDYYRYIHVPEEWSRMERNRRNMRMIFRVVGWGVILAVWLGGIVMAIISWSRKKFSVKTFLLFALFMLALSLIGLVNKWPEIMAAFSTAQPLNNQVLITVIGASIGAIGMAGAVGLVVGYIHISRPAGGQGLLQSLAVGLGVGFAFAGLSAALNHFGPSPLPQWADYSPLGARLPLLGVALSPLNRIILNTAFMGLVLLGLDRVTAGWTRRKVVAVLAMLLLGAAITAVRSTDDIVFWLASGGVVGLLLLLSYALVFRFQLSALPFAVSALVILGLIKQAAMQAIPPAVPGAALGIAAALLLAILWARQLES